MITDQDIEKLKQVFATKDDIMDLKQDVSSLKEDVSEIKLEMKEFVKKKDLGDLGATISSEFNIVIDMVGDLHTKFDEQQVEIRSTRIFKGEAEARLQGIERQILRISK
ncbi:MAG TPA: JlpA family lipoprotein adhesin [Candidatus Woesebacteria bacterium]|nr:JlpA family lipoprotein adhesin [Candidatus Woesebacteria bacterium]